MNGSWRITAAAHVADGSWLCENARMLDGDRRSYSFKTVLAVKLASAFNLENELKNIVLAVFRSFVFLHSARVKMRTTHIEQNESALALIADVRAVMDFSRYG